MLNLFAIFLLSALVHAAPQPVTSLPTATPSWLRFLSTVANFALDSSPPKEGNGIYNIQPRDDSATTESVPTVQSSLLATTISSFSSESLPFATPSPTSSFITIVSSSPVIPSQCLPQSSNVSIPISTIPGSNISITTIPAYTLPFPNSTVTATNDTNPIFSSPLPATIITTVIVPTATVTATNDSTPIFNSSLPATIITTVTLPTAASSIVSNATSTDSNITSTITVITSSFLSTATADPTLSDPCAIYSSVLATSVNSSAPASSAPLVTVSTSTSLVPVPSVVNSSDRSANTTNGAGRALSGSVWYLAGATLSGLVLL